jgi:hypothetical protein
MAFQKAKGIRMSTGRNPACWLEPRPPLAEYRMRRQGPKQSDKASSCENITAGRKHGHLAFAPATDIR